MVGNKVQGIKQFYEVRLRKISLTLFLDVHNFWGNRFHCVPHPSGRSMYSRDRAHNAKTTRVNGILIFVTCLYGRSC